MTHPSQEAYMPNSTNSLWVPKQDKGRLDETFGRAMTQPVPADLNGNVYSLCQVVHSKMHIQDLFHPWYSKRKVQERCSISTFNDVNARLHLLQISIDLAFRPLAYCLHDCLQCVPPVSAGYARLRREFKLSSGSGRTSIRPKHRPLIAINSYLAVTHH